MLARKALRLLKKVPNKGGQLMNLHEYQAKEILREFGIDLGSFLVCHKKEEIRDLVNASHYEQAVIKAQVHAGGRGKAGGVKIAHSQEEIIQYASEMIGKKIVTKQTGVMGKPIHSVLIAPLSEIKKEFYFAITIDRANGRACLMVSSQGGVNIEELAQKNPAAIYKQAIPFHNQLRSDHLWNLSKFLHLNDTQRKSAFKLIPKLVEAFFSCDASLLEINPLIINEKDELFCLDARMSIDDNALFRHPKLAQMFDSSQLPIQEVQSAKHDLSYIALDGNIGCMVNGAGLAMATMDIIKYYGGTPANFLDVGGSADEARISAGFEILMSDPHVEAILVNIFGGIMNCATIAKGIISVLKSRPLNIPLIVRMEGTNVEEGRRLLRDCGLNLITAENLSDAAQKAVEAVEHAQATTTRR